MRIKILISLILFNSTLHAADIQYSITPLGTLGGNESSPTDINDNGEIVGSSLTAQNISHAFYSSVINGERVIADLSSSQNNNNSIAKAINNNGQVVGSFQVSGEVPLSLPSDTTYISHAFIANRIDNAWVMRDLNREGDVASSAEDINDSAQITGYLYAAVSDGRIKSKPFFADKIDNDWSITNLYPEVTGRGSEGVNINNSGQLAVQRSLLRPVRLEGLSVVNDNGAWQVSNLGTLGGSMAVTGINDSNQMSGYSRSGESGSRSHTVIANKTENGWTLTDLGQVNDQSTFGQDINNAGVVIGFSKDAEIKSAFIYINEQMHPLMDFVSSGQEGWTSLQSATSINNLNQIVGVGEYNGETTAYLLTPIADGQVEQNPPITSNPNSAICEIGLDPQTIRRGEGTALWWWSDAVASASINNDIGSISIPSDFNWIYPEETTRYTMTANGTDGTLITCEATIIVEGQIKQNPSIANNSNTAICEIGLDPQTIRRGEGTALWWWSDAVASASINNGIGSISLPSDFNWIYPEETATYTMTANGTDGTSTTCETTIIVEEPKEIILGTVDIDSNAAIAFSADEKIAYLADGNQGFKVVDVSNPSQLSIIATLNTTGFLNNIVLSSDGTKAFVSSTFSTFGDEFVQIIDISNPKKPKSLSKISISDLVGNFQVVEDKIYVATYNYPARVSYIQVIDISEVRDPRNVQKIKMPNYTNHFVFSKEANRIYAISTGAIQVIDFDNESNAKVVGSIATGGSLDNIALSNDGNIIFVVGAEGERGGFIIDVNNPQNPILIDTIDTWDASDDIALSSDGTKAYITNNDLQIWDISNPKEKFLIQKVDIPLAAHDIVISSDTTKAYITSGYAGGRHQFHVVNISSF